MVINREHILLNCVLESGRIDPKPWRVTKKRVAVWGNLNMAAGLDGYTI